MQRFAPARTRNLADGMPFACDTVAGIAEWGMRLGVSTKPLCGPVPVET
jgi:hypothetical protein